MNPRVEYFGRRPTHLACGQLQAALRVNGGLMLGEDNESRAALVQAGIPPRCDFSTARECKAQMDTVAHLIGSHGALDPGSDLFCGRDLGIGNQRCGPGEKIEV